MEAVTVQFPKERPQITPMVGASWVFFLGHLLPLEAVNPQQYS